MHVRDRITNLGEVLPDDPLFKGLAPFIGLSHLSLQVSAAAHSKTIMNSSPSIDESKYCTILSCCSDWSKAHFLQTLLAGLVVHAVHADFLTATMLSSDKRLARWTTANLPLPMGLMSSYLPSIIVWGAAWLGSWPWLLGCPRSGCPHVSSGSFTACVLRVARAHTGCAHCGWRQASGKPKSGCT